MHIVERGIPLLDYNKLSKSRFNKHFLFSPDKSWSIWGKLFIKSFRGWKSKTECVTFFEERGGTRNEQILSFNGSTKNAPRLDPDL